MAATPRERPLLARLERAYVGRPELNARVAATVVTCDVAAGTLH
ncbi:MAG TPA: hypothetical protein VKM54_22210 [Myxococcota bacterium]|nr:hypothetical protein [Myxococcota bacterium]